MRVVFVCSGNICRSPMAAEYLRHRAPHAGLSHVVVDSAGTLGIEGRPASPEAVRVMREVGVDLSRHRSKGVSSAILTTADVVIVMAHDHLDVLAHRFPEGNDRRLLIRAFENGSEPAPDAPDLEDPISQPESVYREQVEILGRCLDHLMLYLRHFP